MNDLTTDPEPNENSRPTSALEHGTSRAYAAELAALKDGPNRSLDTYRLVLQDAASGLEVDVEALREAATQTISLVLGKKAWPIKSRENFAAKARHLIYWADAIINNHLDQLPAYAEGERSRRIEELQSELEKINEQYETTQANFTAIRQERDHLQGLIDDTHATLTEASQELAAAIKERDAFRSALEAVVAQHTDAPEKVLEYAQAFIDGFMKARA